MSVFDTTQLLTDAQASFDARPDWGNAALPIIKNRPSALVGTGLRGWLMAQGVRRRIPTESMRADRMATICAVRQALSRVRT